MALPVQAPVRKPRQGGIRDIVGQFVNEPRLAAVSQAGGLSWEDSTCGFPRTTRAGCYDDAVAAVEKYGDSVNQYTSIGEPFAQYAGVECWIGGDSEGASFQEQARQKLEAGEERLIEGNLWTWASDADVTGSAASIAAAIGDAEEYADDNYVGQPILLLSRRGADLAFAASVLTRENGRLVTPNGTPVLASGAFTSGPADEVAIIGGLLVLASPIVAHQAPNLSDNTALAIAERVYAVGVDCDFRYIVTVTPA